MPELNSDEILHCFERLAELETEFEEVDIQIREYSLFFLLKKIFALYL
jgi:hypothetical protein